MDGGTPSILSNISRCYSDTRKSNFRKIGLIGIVVFTKECLFVLFNYINYQSVIYSGNNKESLEISLVKGQGTLVLVSAYLHRLLLLE